LIAEPEAGREARDRQICDRYRGGETLEQIGARFGLSHEGVRRVALRFGLNKRNAGLAVRVRRRPPASEVSPSFCWRTYGCSPEALARIAKPARQAFLYQRRNVKRFAAEWNLSLPEWLEIWDASGQWDRRGQGPARYGMTRIDFSRPVSADNVMIVLNREAVRLARRRALARNRGIDSAAISVEL